MKTVLSIAGSDCSGGAGIQADLKTLTALGVYGMTAITAITVQNTCGVRAVEAVSPELLRAQITAVLEDIPADAVKVGMVADAEQAAVIADCLRRFSPPHIVVDTVLRATSGAVLSEGMEVLFPLAELITPNIPEAEQLTGLPVRTGAERCTAAAFLRDTYGCAVLLKGGHAERADDLLCTAEGMTWLRGERINTPDTHGTGCTLSSGIAAFLAMGLPLPEAVRKAKAYLTGAIAAGLHLGHGNGPLDHMYLNRKEF